MRRLGVSVAILIPVLLLALAGYALVSRNPDLSAPAGPPAAHGARSGALAAIESRHRKCGSFRAYSFPVIGLAPGANVSRKLAVVRRRSGIAVNVVSYYRAFGKRFDRGYACMVLRDGAVPLIQWLPRHISLTALSAGRYDPYLSAYARAVKAFRYPVIISFAHEMNGNWETWGWQHTTPAAFKAAWQHIHRIFAAAAASNVTWLWNINRLSPSSPDSRQWWPGRKYVTWVGVDAYFRSPAQRFTTVFGNTIRHIRAFTHDPILIAETGVGRRPREAAQIEQLFAGATRTPGLLGFVWFDINAKERWRIDDYPPALAAFRRAASRYLT